MLAEGTRPLHQAGTCEIDLARREIRVFGSPIRVGGRAFELIEVLARSAGELVTKDNLMSSVWPGAVVMEGTLHVHIAAVRKSFGAHRSLLRTESRRGYRLLGDWRILSQSAAKLSAVPSQIRVTREFPETNFPAASTHLIGRAAAAQSLRNLLSAYRVVTLTGTGGIGKTALALKVARSVLGEFTDGGWLVELASLADPELVPSAVAGALGLSLNSDIISAEAVAGAIVGKAVLLVLDNCEHVIGAAAGLAETFIRLVPRSTVLATSRELLRIEGEHAYRVMPLEAPAAVQQAGVDQIMSHSAPQLFIARARELGSDFSANVNTLQTVAEICRRLDGIPLAIELAASRAATLGVGTVAAGLRNRFTMLTTGRRTALPRHRTLRATLDWSYQLLPDAERSMLQRLAVFSAGFSLAAANSVANPGKASESEIADRLANLVAKSLIASDLTGQGNNFRLLETIRAYALLQLTESGELQEASKRHAQYYIGILNGIEHEWQMRLTPVAWIDNTRAALEWCFGPDGNLGIGVRLAAAAVPVFLAMSLFPECHRWSELAIRALDDASHGGPEEMHLQTSLGISSMQMHGQSDAARRALSRGLAIAEARGDVLTQVGVIGMLSMFDVRDGDFNTSLHYAQLSRAVTGLAENPAAMALANSILGRALQFVGNHAASRAHLDASFRYWSRSPETGEIYLGLDHHALVGIGLARNSWLQGYPRRATDLVRQTIRSAEIKGHPASLGLALSWAPGIFLWTGDLRSAEEHTDRLLSHARSHSLRPYVAVARGYAGALALRRRDAGTAVEDLRDCLTQLHAMRYRMFNTEFKLSLVQGLLALGQIDDGLALVADTIRLIEANGDLVHMPEALRVKAGVLLAAPQPRRCEAERCYTRSLELSRRQGARSWELRTTIDLAALWAAQGERERAWMTLRPLYAEFQEGFDSEDIKAAQHLLGTLR